MAKNNFLPRSKFEKWVRRNGGTKGVAIALNVSQPTVQNWLAGYCKPNMETAYRLIDLSGEKLTYADILQAYYDARKR